LLVWGATAKGANYDSRISYAIFSVLSVRNHFFLQWMLHADITNLLARAALLAPMDYLEELRARDAVWLCKTRKDALFYRTATAGAP